MEDKEDKISKTKDIIRLYTMTTLVLWKSICDDLEKYNNEEESNKQRIKEEQKKTNEDKDLKIRLFVDEETEHKNLANERKELIKKIKNTEYKDIYTEYDENINNFEKNIKSIKTNFEELKRKYNTELDESKLNIATSNININTRKYYTNKITKYQEKIDKINKLDSRYFDEIKNEIDKDIYYVYEKNNLFDEKITTSINQQPTTEQIDNEIDKVIKKITNNENIDIKKELVGDKGIQFVEKNEQAREKKEAYLRYLKKIRRNEPLDPFKIEDVFNKNNIYDKDDYLKLTTSKQEMYQKFFDNIRKAKNTSENNNLNDFNKKLKNINEKFNLDIINSDNNSNNWLNTLINIDNKIDNDIVKLETSLLDLSKNIQNNIGKIFLNRFSLVRLIYYDIKKIKLIGEWKQDYNKNIDLYKSDFTNSINKRVNIIKKINTKLKDKYNKSVALWLYDVQSRYLTKKKQCLSSFKKLNILQDAVATVFENLKSTNFQDILNEIKEETFKKFIETKFKQIDENFDYNLYKNNLYIFRNYIIKKIIENKINDPTTMIKELIEKLKNSQKDFKDGLKENEDELNRIIKLIKSFENTYNLELFQPNDYEGNTNMPEHIQKIISEIENLTNVQNKYNEIWEKLKKKT